jgi:hypothetical protein
VSFDEERALRQFEALWAEIARRSNAQQALVAATVTAAGTIGGLVVAEKADSVLLVVLAVVAPIFGLLWLDHARNIGDIGEFIRCHWQGQPNWEQHQAERKYTAGGKFRFFIFITAVTLVFVGPAVSGLIASAGQLDGKCHFLASWIGAAVLTALFVVSWSIQVIQTLPKQPSHRSQSDKDAGPS